MRKILFVVYMLTFAFHTVAGIVVSETLPSVGIPEHRYTMANGSGWYVNSTTSPTKNAANYAQLAFYASDKATDAYYIYPSAGLSMR